MSEPAWQKANINKVHPHKFRRTLAARAIDKGRLIEQVQHLLGHKKLMQRCNPVLRTANLIMNTKKRLCISDIITRAAAPFLCTELGIITALIN